MGVTVDEAGQNGCLREVNHIRTRWNLEVGSRGHTLDAITLDHNDHVFPDIIAGRVEETSDQEIGHFRGYLLGGGQGCSLCLAEVRQGEQRKNYR